MAMKFIAGLVVGLVLVSTVTVFADVLGWMTGSKLMDKDYEFRRGYVAGASDMLDNVVQFNEDSKDPAFERYWFAKQAKCLDERSKGGLSQFVTWAEHLFLGRNAQASSLLMDNACD
jgi:hypothetical protein